jgi:hypothetical protein
LETVTSPEQCRVNQINALARLLVQFHNSITPSTCGIYGVAEHHVNDRDPESECRQWLADNGYSPIEGTKLYRKP